MLSYDNKIKVIKTGCETTKNINKKSEMTRHYFWGFSQFLTTWKIVRLSISSHDTESPISLNKTNRIFSLLTDFFNLNLTDV